MKRKIIRWLWKNHRDYLLDKRGFKNNSIHYEEAFLELFMELYSEKRTEMTIREMYNLYRIMEKIRGVNGDIAEVGVYKGGSAKIICELKGRKKFLLFDTFEGMPDVHEGVDRHKRGDFSDTTLEDVRKFLGNYRNLEFYKGYFPESAKSIDASRNYCFVHLDVDLYKSTMDCLKYFYPKLNKGGMLLSHDYCSISCPGVQRSFKEFFLDKPEPILELWDTQCMIIKF